MSIVAPLELTSTHSFASAPPVARWNALLAGSTSNVVFLTRQYQEAWWQAFGVTEDCSCTPHILSAYSGGDLIGLASFYLASVTPADMQEEAERQPVTLRVQARAGVADTEALSVPAPGERVVRLIGGVAVTDYLDILAAPGDLEATWEAVFAYWADRRDDWDVLDLHSLPADSPSRAIVAHLAARYGWNSWTGIEETCPSVTLPTDWESYLAGLDKKSRHELRRKLRKVEAATEALTWQVVNSPAALPATVEQFLALHRLSNAAKATFMDRRMTGFFRDLTTTMAGPGGLEVALLCWGDRPVAAYLSFVYGGRVYLYNSGYDPQYAEWSVGLVLLARRIGEAIAAGLTCFDFLRGDERYKYDLGGMDHFVHRVLVRHNG